MERAFYWVMANNYVVGTPFFPTSTAFTERFVRETYTSELVAEFVEWREADDFACRLNNLADSWT